MCVFCFLAHKCNHFNLLHRSVITLLACSQLLLDSYHTGKSQDSVLRAAPQFVSWVNNITLSADEDTQLLHKIDFKPIYMNVFQISRCKISLAYIAHACFVSRNYVITYL